MAGERGGAGEAAALKIDSPAKCGLQYSEGPRGAWMPPASLPIGFAPPPHGPTTGSKPLSAASLTPQRSAASPPARTADQGWARYFLLGECPTEPADAPAKYRRGNSRNLPERRTEQLGLLGPLSNRRSSERLLARASSQNRSTYAARHFSIQHQR